MKTNNNIPAYRFQGYTDAWELRKLGEVVEVCSGRDYKHLGVGSIPVYGTGGYMLSVSEALSKNNDAIGIGRKGTIDSPYILRAPFWTVDTLFYCIPNDGFTLEFAYSIFQNINWKSMDESTGVPSLSKNGINNVKVLTPKIKEQSAIGTFFSTLDQHITLHQRKLDMFKEQKKTYLKLLFPAKGQTKPALRFQGFEDDWEEVKLGEVLIKNSKRNKDLRIINVESVSNRLGFVKQTEQFEDYSVASSDLSNYYVISEKQFAYNPSRINVGSIAYKKLGEESSVVSPLYVSFSTSENVEDYYLWYWFKTELFHSQRIVFSEGGVRDTLSYNQLSEIILSLPSLPEQEVIGTFFSTLDQEIAQVEDKLASLKEMKKTLLRKLFV